jgi:hypothetical protein
MLIGGAVATIYYTESPLSVTRDAAQQKLKKLKQKY